MAGNQTMKLEPTTDLDTQVPLDRPGTAPRRGFRAGAFSWLALAIILLAVLVLLRHRHAREGGCGAEAGHHRRCNAHRRRHPAEARRGRREVVFPGNVRAYTDAAIYARTSGYLKKWYVDIGTRVEAASCSRRSRRRSGSAVATGHCGSGDGGSQLSAGAVDGGSLEGPGRLGFGLEAGDGRKGRHLNAKKAIVESGRANLKRLEQLHAFGRSTRRSPA